MEGRADPKTFLFRHITTVAWIIISVIAHCQAEFWLICKDQKCACPPLFPRSKEFTWNSTEPSTGQTLGSDVGSQFYSFVSCKGSRYSLVFGTRVVALDVKQKRVFLCVDGRNATTIYHTNLDERKETVVSIVGAGNGSTAALVYDWIGENVYIAKGRYLLVCALRGGNCGVIYESPLSGITPAEYDKIYNVDLDPNHGLIFFEVNKCIMRATMDGLETERIVDPIHNFYVGLAVDQEASRILWGEFDFLSDDGHVLWSVDYKGREKTIVDRVEGAFRSIAVLGHIIFWIQDRTINAISKKVQYRGTTISRKIIDPGGKTYPLGIVAYHRTTQPRNRINHCAGELCPNKICVLTARYFRCVGQLNSQISADGNTCPGITASNNATPHDSKDECRNNYACSNGACVDYALVCDGKHDCEDCSDEGPRCQDGCGNMRCAYRCHSAPRGPRCTCRPGYRVAADSISCEDLDECKMEPPVCESMCVNYNGSYECVDSLSDYQTAALAAAIPTVVSLLVVAIAVSAVYKYWQASKVLRKLTPEEMKEFLEGNESVAVALENGVEQAMHLPFRMILQPDDVVIAKEAVLGSGNFGIVYRGFHKSEAVAIKTFKRTVEIDAFKAVLAETKIMAYLGQHEHVIQLIGAEISQILDRKIALVTELSPHGDLLHYLRKLDPSHWQTEGGCTPEGVRKWTLLSWCSQIASGMEHLEAKKIVHGDLATRNILVFKDNIVKITDFGLSKQLFANSEYHIKRTRPVPWKWCALELLTLREFSTDSDIWAFGVTAWEILSLGRCPYEQHRQLTRGFIRYLEQGNRLSRPDYASYEMYAILLTCWNVDRSTRPRFATLKEVFQESMNITAVSRDAPVTS